MGDAFEHRKGRARGRFGGRCPWIIFPWVAIAPLFACGAPAGDEATASSVSAIYGGVEDNAGAQNQGVVALKIGDGGTTFELCSGALVAPNVVLTARHCVSTQTSMSVTCDQNGVSSNAADFGADVAAPTIHVLTGPTPALLGTPSANGLAIFHPTGTTLCNLDLALVVLDAPVTGIAPLPVRLKGPVVTAESVRAVGYGQNDQNAPVGTRFRKDGVAVLAVGSTISSSQTPLGSSEFEVGESMCQGDSGGPAIDETTGAVVGIVSRGGACTDTTGHIYTSTAGFASVFQQAFAMAGGAPIAEGTTAPSGDAGAAPTPVPEAGAAPAPAPTTPPGQGSGSGGASSGGAAPTSVNLRAGQGHGCTLSGEGGTGSGAAARGEGLAAAACAAFLVALAWARRRSASALCSHHGRTRPPVR